MESIENHGFWPGDSSASYCIKCPPSTLRLVSIVILFVKHTDSLVCVMASRHRTTARVLFNWYRTVSDTWIELALTSSDAIPQGFAKHHDV